MDTHKNAPLTPKGREAMVRSVIDGTRRQGQTDGDAAWRLDPTTKPARQQSAIVTPRRRDREPVRAYLVSAIGKRCPLALTVGV